MAKYGSMLQPFHILCVMVFYCECKNNIWVYSVCSPLFNERFHIEDRRFWAICIVFHVGCARRHSAELTKYM